VIVVIGLLSLLAVLVIGYARRRGDPSAGKFEDGVAALEAGLRRKHPESLIQRVEDLSEAS